MRQAEVYINKVLAGILTESDNGVIRLTRQGEQGRYILKPAPAYRLRFLEQMPANERLTMQIARQVYSIITAENGIIFFSNQRPAYITKRFDVLPCPHRTPL